MAKKTRKRSKFRVILYLIGFILLIVALSFGAVLVTLGMLPSFVASYVDGSKDRNAFRVVAACNFSGVLPFLVDLLRKGEITSDNVYSILFTPHAWLAMYGAAAFGWALVWLFPRGGHFALQIVQKSSANSLREKQQQIVDEWGSEVEATSRRALRNAAFTDEHKKA